MKIFETINKILLKHYRLGEVIRVEQNFRGYINTNYEFETLRYGSKYHYVLRHYTETSKEKNIQFEHALLNELEIRKFDLSPRLVKTVDNKTYLKFRSNIKNGEKYDFMAVFKLLPGEDRYTWDGPLCTTGDLKNAAKTLALYHKAIFGWEKTNPDGHLRMVDQLLSLPMKWENYAKRPDNSSFSNVFMENLDVLQNFLMHCLNTLDINQYDMLPHLAIHGDYHPGNLRFCERKVVGVCDFEWSKLDARCFDIALALIYFCAAWKERIDGALLPNRVIDFLKAYQMGIDEKKGIRPLTDQEIKFLPQMIYVSNLIVLDWVIDYGFYSDNHSPECLKYLMHSIRLFRWLEANGNLLKKCVMGNS
jgi:homoserine kinase type II